MSTPNRLMDLESWKREAQAGHAPADAVLHKDVDTEVRALDPKTRQVRFRITTGAVDRMKDTIDPTGWDLKNWKANPVFLWAHQYGGTAAGPGLPIAKGVDIAADAKGLTAVAQFATRDQYEFADTVYQLILGGFLKATSVGFKPLKHVYNEQRGGVDFLQQELLEVSVVPIPANPEALIESKGIDLGPMRSWLALQPGGRAGGRTKDRSDCPAGTRCPNLLSSDPCPAGQLCPMFGPAHTSWRSWRTEEPILILADDGPDEYVLEISDDKTVHVDLGDLARAFVDVIDAEVRSVLGRAKGDPDYSPSRIVPRGGRRI